MRSFQIAFLAATTRIKLPLWLWKLFKQVFGLWNDAVDQVRDFSGLGGLRGFDPAGDDEKDFVKI